MGPGKPPYFPWGNMAASTQSTAGQGPLNFLPAQTEYPEEMPWSHAILNTHVAYRGFQTGAFLAIPISGARYLYQARRQRQAAVTATTTTPASRVSATTAAAANAAARPVYARLLVRTAGYAAPGFALLSALGVTGMMIGREEIEWQDRAWRLRGNPYQREVDVWSMAGMGVATVGLVLRGPGAVGVVGGVGALALANAAAVTALMGWRQVGGSAAGKADEKAE
jgi:hypothetical protein